MEKKPLHIHYITAFWVTLSVSIFLIVTGLFLPEKGQIHGSVLTSVGELFLWPALAFGAKALEEGKSATIQHGNTTIQLGDADVDPELIRELDETEEED